MRPARTELTLTEWIVLTVIGEGPTHGWAIARALRPEGSLGAVWSCRAPLVYRAIRLLEGAGLVASTGPAAGRGPSRTILEITPAGSEAMGDWLAEPVAHVRDLRTELLVKLLLHERRGRDPSLLVRRQRELLVPIAAGLTDRVPAASGGERLVVAWRAMTAQAALEFLEAIGTTATG
jgi:DNA-binding PadR family transcriptional regulator